MRFNHPRDKSYEDAVKYLTENSDRIEEAWDDPLHKRGGSLFVFASKTGTFKGEDDKIIGCLTSIRSAEIHVSGCSPEVTKAIRTDSRLPHFYNDITVESLVVFAEWQRRLDHEFQDKEV